MTEIHKCTSIHVKGASAGHAAVHLGTAVSFDILVFLVAYDDLPRIFAKLGKRETFDIGAITVQPENHGYSHIFRMVPPKRAINATTVIVDATMLWLLRLDLEGVAEQYKAKG